jgi:putative transposase
MRFRFVEEQRGAFPIDRLCQVLNVSSRGLRAFRNRPASRRQRTDLVVLAHIKEQSRLSLGSYGRPRMTEELKEVGVDVGHRRVGRLMRENGITVERTRKFKATTDSNHTFNIAPNLLDRDFRSAEPKMGGRHQLHLDPRGLAVSGSDPRSAFPACHWLGCQQSHEA